MRIPVVIVGAGPAGLAMSHDLTAFGIDHVVLERGEVAHSWRTERWDSLRLLTPNWMSALPGYRYQGDDPDGFMTASETVAYLDRYRRTFAPPVLTGVTVRSVRRTADGFDVISDAGAWQCDAVVAATGASSEPRVPALAADLPARLDQLSALDYRRPAQLDADGEVLVVGASASGVQIADEVRRAGRAVTIAVGEHVRLPRSYRGRDVYWWLDAIGQLDERYDEVDDVDRARRHASVQLVGTVEHVDLDLNSLRERGVQVVGRLAGVSGTDAQCSGALASLVTNADLKQARLLGRIDDYIAVHGLEREVAPATAPAPTQLPTAPTRLALAPFSTVIWATGYRPSYPWLDPAAFDHRHRIAHDGGVTKLPGLYVLGLPFLRRRRSNLMSGVGRDAADLGAHLRAYLDQLARRRGAAPTPASTAASSSVGRSRQQRVARSVDEVFDRA
jgi:putative flavoprotein involved in K+ transport